MIARFLPVLFLAALGAAEDSMSNARLERMLADGDREMVVQVFRRNSDNVLSFIDQYLEGGLKMIETSQDDAGALKSFRTGIAFAKLADEAFPGRGYTDYAATFASWSPTEQEMFRKGQAAYKSGRKATEPEEALEHYQRSLQLAQSINDLWGVAMTQAAIVHTELKLNRPEKVEQAAYQATQACDKLGLRLDSVRIYVAWGDSAASTAARGHGANHYNHAFQMLGPDDKPELRKEIIDKWVAALQRAGQPDAAEIVRKQYGDDPADQ